MTPSTHKLEARPAPTRTQKRAGKTRRRLLDAAMDMFCENGIDRTSIEDITERADLGKGTFYRHFAGKQEVVAALIEDALDRLVERIAEIHQPPGDLRGALDHLLAVHCQWFLDHRQEFVLLFQGRLLLKLERDAEGDLEQPYTSYLGEIETWLGRYVAQPIDPVKVRRVAYAVAGFVSGFLSFAMIGMEADEIERSLQPLRTAFVQGLLAFLGQGATVDPPAGPKQA